VITAQRLYEKLLAHYGDLNWWPADTPYEVIVGAILTQNTAWHNVEKAIANFDGDLSPNRIMTLDHAALEALIRPAGFFKQKAVYLKAITAWFEQYQFNVDTVREKSLAHLRAELLAVRGVGMETADAILLYAFNLPTFVVDNYTMRLCERIPLDAGHKYMDVKTYFERNLPANVQLYNNFHALIVIHGKEHCRKKPVCEGCPLVDDCARLIK